MEITPRPDATSGRGEILAGDHDQPLETNTPTPPKGENNGQRTDRI